MNLLVSLFGSLAVFAILMNFSMYFLFLGIRKLKQRKLRKNLAFVARKWMKTHRPMAGIATLLILLHIISVLQIRNDYLSVQFMSGVFAGATLLILLITGLFRNRKATGKRRRAHQIMAFVFVLSVLIHLLTSY